MSNHSKHAAIQLAPPKSTGTGRFSAQGLVQYNRLAVEFEVEAVGATPTATFTIQGLKPGGNVATASDWVDLMYLDSDGSVAASKAGITVTAVGRTSKFIDGLNYRFFDAIAVNVTANTNVTFHANVYPGSDD